MFGIFTAPPAVGPIESKMKIYTKPLLNIESTSSFSSRAMFESGKLSVVQEMIKSTSLFDKLSLLSWLRDALGEFSQFVFLSPSL